MKKTYNLVLLALMALMIAQGWMMRWFVADPVPRAIYYSGFGVPLFVTGMMISAFGLRSLTGT